MATYVNDLRLKEITTGDEAGTWGTSTNTNLRLIGEALGYGILNCFSADSSSATTVADGASDAARSMYFKVTSSATLTGTRTLIIAPNTMSRVMLIENATLGGQSIAVSQGSGANVTIPNGQTKMVYLDGAGSGAAVVDAFAALSAGAITGTTGQFNTSLNVDGTVTADGLTVDGETILTKTGTNASPHIKLTESGDTREFNIFNDGSGNGRLVLADTDDTPDTEIVLADNGILQVKTANTERFNIGSGGDISFYEDTGTTPKFFWDASAESLGIGTSSPSDLMTIQSPASGGGNGITIKRNDNGTDQRVGAISFGNTVDSDLAQITVQTSLGNNGDGNLLFHTQPNAGSSTERMRIDSSGNVGIGTSSPSGVLHLSADTSATTLPSIVFEDTGTTSTRLGSLTNDNGDLVLAMTASLTDLRAAVTLFDDRKITFTTNASEAMRIDSSGNVGIGTSSPATALDVVGTATISGAATAGFVTPLLAKNPSTNAASSVKIGLDAGGTTWGEIGASYNTNDPYMAFFVRSGSEKVRITDAGNVGYNGKLFSSNDLTTLGGLQLYRDHATGSCYLFDTTAAPFSGPLIFGTNNSEAMRIDTSGNLLVGLTDISDATSRSYGNAFSGSSANANWKSWGSGSHTHAQFRNGTSVVGSITTTTSATAYNTSSDARLKENIADAEDAGTKVDAIQVRQFDWKADGSHQDYGMIAQELMTVAPEAVHQPDDPEEMMGVDYSKLVPMMLKEIQSLRARVAQLEGA